MSEAIGWIFILLFWGVLVYWPEKKPATCKHTRIEETINAAALEISKMLTGDEYIRWKYKVEDVLKKYFGEGL